jgi:hypothetical protein
MDPHSKVYQTINTILFMGIFILIFIFQILPMLASFPFTAKILGSTGFVNLISTQIFDIGITIGGICLGLYLILNAYLGAKKHRFATFTGKKAEVYALIYMGLGVLLIIVCLSFFSDLWKTS